MLRFDMAPAAALAFVAASPLTHAQTTGGDAGTGMTTAAPSQESDRGFPWGLLGLLGLAGLVGARRDNRHTSTTAR